MSGLFGGGSSINNSAPVISSLQLQTSSLGRALPWVFGTTRIAPNLIQYEDFASHAHTKSQRAGKGGGATQTQTDYTYTACAIFALASGPLASVGRVWRDKEKSSLAELALDFYNGSADQTPYPYLQQKHPDRALSYRGIAYAASGAYDLGSNASIGNHTMEVSAPGTLADTWPDSGVPDAEIADVITALLTDPDQGVGLAPDAIANMDAFRAFCLAAKLWVSPAYTDQTSAWDLIKTLLQIGFADCVYTDGKLKIVPYSDVPAESDFGQYLPTIAPVAALDDSALLIDGDNAALTVTQVASDDTYNHIRVSFRDRENDYVEAIAEVSDDADIAQHGKRSRDVIDLPEIADKDVAQRVAGFILHRSLYVVNQYEFRLPWSYVWLEPLDIVTLTYAPHQLQQVPILITEITEDDGGMLTVLAEDYPQGTNSGTPQPSPDGGGTTPNHAAQPGPAAAPVLFEPPGHLTGNEPQLWLATSGGPFWGGAILYASLDDQHYQRIGSIRGGAIHGQLLAPLAAASGIDSGNTLSVALTSGGELTNTSEQSARDMLTASYVDGEYLSFAHVTLSGAGQYALQYLVRGAFGSTPASHASGTPFVYLDSSVFRWTYPREWLGRTVHIKLASFNVFGGQVQDVSEVVSYPYQLTGSGIGAVGSLTALSRVFAIELNWSLPVAQLDQVAYSEIWFSRVASRSGAQLLGQFAAPQSTHTITGLKAGEKLYFWVRLVDKMGSVGAWFPAGAGVEGETAKDAKVILDWLVGQIGATQLGADLRRQIDLIDTLDLIRDGQGANHLNALLAANNAVLRESQARADALLAEANSRGSAVAQVQGRIDTVSAATNQVAAAVQTEVVARTTATEALAAQITTVAATAAGNTAAITTEQIARASADSAMAQSINVLSARTNDNASAISSEQTARASADGALGQRIDTVQAAISNTAAALQTEQTARASADGALGQRIDTVQAVANGASAAVQVTNTALAGTNGKLAALSTIKTQITSGGRTYLAGIGVGVEQNGQVVESQILLSAQRVAVLNEDSGGLSSPFAVSNGQVFINSAFIADASITRAKIASLAVDTLQLAGNAVTVPLYLSGSGGASGVSNGQSIAVGQVTANFNDVVNVVLIVNWQAATAGAGTNTTVSITANGGGVLFAADSAPANLSTSHSATGRALLQPGQYTFVISFGNNWPSGSYDLGNWSVTILGVKR